ncbi:hypothetical protein CSPHI_00710 [Corynebacterium sphenisci DSM 44792]|uniref:Uncharacterized protein n=1 Tax=Corynebacterium sphenisci DSM 44792 TaxID=1437874 RepID=A0A1L7CVG4_9CORY|nr:hypothetical protein [Corynebacterium sphenisci]APT89856.1 hypothetical protein CSPHI_00710 [Corynebacterium sphenisci DSM 44792]
MENAPEIIEALAQFAPDSVEVTFPDLPFANVETINGDVNFIQTGDINMPFGRDANMPFGEDAFDIHTEDTDSYDFLNPEIHAGQGLDASQGN